MKRIKTLIAMAITSAIAATVPANAQTVHVAGAGSSAQFLSAAIGADILGLSLTGVGLPNIPANPSNCSTQGQALTTYHYSAKNAAYVVDNRSSQINPEKGNLWVVWTASCSDSTANVNDIWLDVSVDSTVGVRAVLAQETSGPGAQIGVAVPPAAPGNLVSPNTLFPDNNVDVPLPPAVYNAIGTGITNATAGSDVHVNVGLTDIRPEDALFATTRALNTFTSTLTGLGYRLIAANATLGKTILSGQPGSTSGATPEAFALGGGSDPFTHITVPAITTVPIGAAPIVFAYNNGTAGVGNYPTNLVSGITGNGTAGGPYSLAKLFDGTTRCDTANPAFGGFGGTTANVNLVLREPLSGTMNTTEFSVFRTTGNTADSQEKGVSGIGSGFPKNPLSALPCNGGGGSRSRAIGTGEVVAAIQTQPNALGYFFFSFANASKFNGSSTVNYLNLDGVDPLGGVGTSGNVFPNCTGTNCPASLWPGNLSFSTLRDGTYGAWSLYRWVVYTGSTDPVGPAALAQAAQDAIDTTVADYVPFYTAKGGIGGKSDGLDVYHSHFTDQVPLGSCAPVGTCRSVVGKNGSATPVNATDNGNTLGGGVEQGGDMGGVIEGPFDGHNGHFSGVVTTTATHTLNKGYKVSKTSGAAFVPGSSWEGFTITIAGTNYTIASVPLTGTILYVTTNPGTATGQAYSATAPTAHATAPGILNKRR
jgi:hypothetical protein